jgi:pheromone shutdown-related protein TraB
MMAAAGSLKMGVVENKNAEPVAEVTIGNTRVTLLGTAHISRSSAEKVKELLDTGEYDAVAVELCPSRHNAIVDPDALARMDLFQVIREGKASMVAASLALGAFQQRAAEQIGIQPGAEMRQAIESAQAKKLPVMLIDREVGITLKRIYRNIPWWRRMNLIAGLMASVVSRHEVSEEEIERLKEGDVLESTFAQFAEEEKDLFKPLIDERDRYMVARLRQEVAEHPHTHILAVVGAGHLAGMQKYFAAEQADARQAPAALIALLETVPPGSRWLKYIPWLIVALVFIGFGLGFARSPSLGWQLVVDWVLINGGLAAIGALIAAGHPLTIIGAFIAAPITSLNPTIGAGMVTAAIEVYLRRPKVGDFSQLRSVTTTVKGWWSNRVTRTLLVFMFSTIGSAVGTYVAGFRIYDKLT